MGNEGKSEPSPAPQPEPPKKPDPKPDTPDIDPRFVEAWINREHVICGVRLRPYSLHHALSLAAIDSPLVKADPAPGDMIGWADLHLALAVCAADYEEPFRVPGPFRALWRQARARMGLQSAVEAFRAYQNDYFTAPEVMCVDGNGKALTAPALLSRAVSIQKLLGMEEWRVWTMPIGKLFWMHAAALELVRDDVYLTSEAEGELMHIIKKIQDGILGVDAIPKDFREAAPGADKSTLLDIFGPEGGGKNQPG